MPRGDGTGPRGMGPGTGRGLGQGKGRRVIDGRGLGPGGSCICPVCGTAIPHQRRAPCSLTTCPKCGARMVRQ
jgi:hypothetical protein